MALRGTLESFLPADLLQFLINSKKTGTLRVFDDDDSKFLAFQDGELIFAIHQRQFPGLDNLVQHRLKGDGKATDIAETDRRWDEVVSRAIERKNITPEFAQRNLNSADASRCIRQLKALSQKQEPTVRLGEYLVVKGRVTQRQFERALEEQIASNKRLGEILIAHGVLTDEQIGEAVKEIEQLRGDFGPLYALRRQLTEDFDVTADQFAEAVSEHETSGKLLWDVLVSREYVTEKQMNSTVTAILVDEICDLLLWHDGSFEFFESALFEDAFASNGLPRVHEHTYDLRSLLLTAHSELDELKSNGLQTFSLKTVFVLTDETKGAERDGGVDKVLRSVNGRSCLQDVRSVLPGNRFQHYRIIARNLSDNVIRPLDRGEAYERGEVATTENRHEEALNLFEHALTVPGVAPSNTQIRGAVQAARAALTDAGAPVPKARYERSASWLAFRRRVTRLSYRVRLGLEGVFIRTGCARVFWAIDNAAFEPMRRGLPASLTLSRRLGVLAALCAVATVAAWAFWPRVDADSGPVVVLRTGPVVHASSQPAGEELPVLAGASLDLDAPVEVPPTTDGARLYTTSRDGMLRCFEPRITGDSASEYRERWQFEVGEYGDIVSEPVLAVDAVYVTSSRRNVFAVTRNGTLRWRRTVSKLDPVAPTPIVSETDESLLGLVVVAREAVVVLSIDDGRELYRLRTQNRITARPVVRGSLLFVGSGDNTIYAADWQERQVVWRQEKGDDIVFLRLVAGALAFATRNGRIGALTLGGTALWSRGGVFESVDDLQRRTWENHVLLSSGEQMELVSLETGEASGAVSVSSDLKVASYHTHAGTTFCVLKDGRLVELQADGAPRWISDSTSAGVKHWTHGETFLAVSLLDGDVKVFSGFDNLPAARPVATGDSVAADGTGANPDDLPEPAVSETDDAGETSSPSEGAWDSSNADAAADQVEK